MTEQVFPTENEIDEFAAEFYGYGDLDAPLWFIGMEEHGGKSADDVSKRIRTWQTRGRSRLEDLEKYHNEIFEGGFSSITKQRTWTTLSRIQLAFENRGTSTQDVSRHWQKRLGRWHSKTCSMELDPLPSPNTKSWNYPKFTDIHFLADRKSYNTRYREKRVQSIKNMIELALPKAVVFYGTDYHNSWTQIAGSEFEQVGLHSIARNGNVIYVSMYHPNARIPGKTNEYLVELGAFLRKQSD